MSHGYDANQNMRHPLHVSPARRQSGESALPYTEENRRTHSEHRILEQGKLLIREKPDALYIWAWKAQIGTAEACADPELAWKAACKVLTLARES